MPPSPCAGKACGIRVRLLNGSTEVDSKTVDVNTAWEMGQGTVPRPT